MLYYLYNDIKRITASLQNFGRNLNSGSIFFLKTRANKITTPAISTNSLDLQTTRERDGYIPYELFTVFLRSFNSQCCTVLCLVAQSCLTLRNPINCRLRVPLPFGILQTIQEWVAMPSSRGSFQPRDQIRSPILQVDSLPSEPPGKPKNAEVGISTLSPMIFLTQ